MVSDLFFLQFVIMNIQLLQRFELLVIVRSVRGWCIVKLP